MTILKMKEKLAQILSDRESRRMHIALMLAPLLLCLVLFVCVHFVTVQQIENQGNLTVENFKTKAHGIIREMQIVSDALISDRDFHHAVNAASEQEFDPVALCETIKSHVDRSPYVSNAYVICKSLDTIYTDNGYYMYDGMRILLKRLISGDVADYELDISDGWHVLNTNYAPPYYVISVPNDNGTDMTTLIVTLDTRQFLTAMYEERASLCCIFNENFSMSTLLLNYPELDWNSPGEISKILGFDVQCFYLETEDFTYLAAIETHDYYAPERTIIGVFGIYAVATLLLGILFLILSKRQQYNTVSALLDTLPQASHQKPSYEELLQTIHKRLKEYQDRSVAEQKRIERDNLQHILMGTITHQPTQEQLKAAGLPPVCEGYYLAAIHINDGPGLIKEGPKNLSVGMTCRLFGEAFADSDARRYDMAVTAFDRHYFAVFSLKDRGIGIEAMRSIIDGKVRFIEEEYGFSLRVTVSSFAPDAAGLPAAYKEAAALNGFIKSVDSNAVLITQDDMRNSIGILMNGDFIKQIQILSNTLELQQFELVPAMADAILEHHVAKLRKNYGLAKNRILTVSTILAEAVVSYQIDETFKREAVAKLSAASSISAVSSAAHQVFEKLAEGAVKAVSPDVVYLAREYIASHYADSSLSIPDVCAAADVSVQYLSRIFRERLGLTMLEYINQTRMEKAKELLLHTALPVSEIALRTGYNNTVTFSRNFKHYVNVSPSEFRNLNK